MPILRTIAHSSDLVLDRLPTFLKFFLLHGIRLVILLAVTLTITVDWPNSPWIVFSTLVVSLIVSILDLNSICLKMLRGQPVKVIGSYDPALLAKVFITTFFVVALITTGFLLFVVPGIILAVLLSFSGFALVDGDGPLQSIRDSWTLVRASFLQVVMVITICTATSIVFSYPLLWGLNVFIDTVFTVSLATIYNTKRSLLKGHHAI